MIINRILRLSNSLFHRDSLFLFAHTQTCPTRKRPVCPSSGSTSSDTPGGGTAIKRRAEPGKVRLGMFPDDWFTFFHSKTGVSGPYILGILLTNYMFSKEIYVMEHEYYAGLSIFVIIVGITKNFGKDIGKVLDSEIDALENELNQGIKNQLNLYETVIKDCQEMQKQAKGQQMLMDAKKENVSMQLEAVYRERLMQAYNAVKGRLEYHSKRTRVLNRIHQKWMLEWILDNVRKSITPDFEKQALNRAIEDLSAMAGRA
ncbi:unnamed protein product [Leptosia nina]|uniref:ATP synthase subunit b n=1 Tax=Leptosia nina TaxID=320188 RepID=A0AAV1K2H4_9NEOP